MFCCLEKALVVGDRHRCVASKVPFRYDYVDPRVDSLGSSRLDTVTVLTKIGLARTDQSVNMGDGIFGLAAEATGNGSPEVVRGKVFVEVDAGSEEQRHVVTIVHCFQSGRGKVNPVSPGGVSVALAGPSGAEEQRRVVDFKLLFITKAWQDHGLVLLDRRRASRAIWHCWAHDSDVAAESDGRIRADFKPVSIGGDAGNGGDGPRQRVKVEILHAICETSIAETTLVRGRSLDYPRMHLHDFDRSDWVSRYGTCKGRWWS